MSPERGHPVGDLAAAGYPWAGPVRTGVIGRHGLEPGPLPRALDRACTPVVAVGSNASPEVLVRKLADHLTHGIPIAPAVVQDLLVGHSAHVSARGYIAAAPARVEGTSTPVAVCWFDAAQLAALDATEPNYRRVALPDGMPCRLSPERVPDTQVPGEAADASGTQVVPAQVYDSVHGVLGEDGAVLPLRHQAGVLAWLAERLPPEGLPADHAALADPEVRERVRQAVIDAGLRAPSGL